MGCWNETCALSGLPIEAGQECYRLKFDDVKLIAFCAVEGLFSYMKHLVSLEYGCYNEYGGLETDTNTYDVGSEDGTVFILKTFWDFAKNNSGDNQKYIEETLESCLKMIDNYHQCQAEYEQHNLDISTLSVFLPSGYHIYKQDPNLYKELLYVLYMMGGLRKTFYTAAYRGAQSTPHALKQMLKMSQEVQKAIELRLSSRIPQK